MAGSFSPVSFDVHSIKNAFRANLSRKILEFSTDSNKRKYNARPFDGADTTSKVKMEQFRRKNKEILVVLSRAAEKN